MDDKLQHSNPEPNAAKDESAAQAVSAQPNTQPQVVYRWTYADQSAFDQKQKRRAKKSGIWAYACVLGVMFTLCIALVIGALVWYGGEDKGKNPASNLTTAQISEQVSPSVVLIYTTYEDGYAYGTGFFLTSDGYIATNHHVIKDCETVTVYLHSGRGYDAEIVGVSVAEDLAVLKIKGKEAFPTLPIGDSTQLTVGEKTVVVGNPAGAEAAFTTTDGIISALDRKVLINEGKYMVELTMIQTSAPVNSGNSGGPLFNEKGEVIGIVTRKLMDYEGIGLALPIKGAMEVLLAIMEDGDADEIDPDFSRVRPNISVYVQNAEEGERVYMSGKYMTMPCDGILVVKQSNGVSGYPLRVNDLICAIDGKTVKNEYELAEALYNYKVGDKAVFKVWRNGTYTDVTVTLGTMLK